MPDAELPSLPSATAPVIPVTSGLKVYTAESITAISGDNWILEKTLICIGISPTNGNQIGSAQFSLLPSTNTDGADRDTQLATTKGTAQDTYKVNFGDEYKNPFYVKITDVIQAEEVPVFYGYISSVTNNIVGARCSCAALSYAGLLDQVGLLGSWWKTPLGTDWYFEAEPVFNPNGAGNKGSGTISSGDISGFVIDETQLILNNTISNKFSAYDVLNLVALHCLHSDATLTSGETAVHPWSFAGLIYRDGFIEYGAGAKELLQASFIVDSYSFTGKSIWGALVEIVQSVDNLIISERFKYLSDDGNGDLKNNRPIIYIAKGA